MLLTFNFWQFKLNGILSFDIFLIRFLFLDFAISICKIRVESDLFVCLFLVVVIEEYHVDNLSSR
ncbi:hypothetical protein Hanom_Chr06g00559841 [Helianthus anomalus]